MTQPAPSHPAPPSYLDDAFQAVLDELLETFLRKHRDYGKGNIMDMGELGIAFRTSEKVARLKHLLSQNAFPDNESLDDTWIDIAVYAVIAMLWRRGQFQNLDVRPEKLVKDNRS